MRLSGAILLLLLLNICAFTAMAQEELLTITVLNQQNRKPVTDAVAYTPNTVLAHTNDKGQIALSANAFRQHKFVIVSGAGYQTDTIWDYKSTLQLKPLSSTLKEVVVNGSKVKRIFNSQADFIADYEVLDDAILLAAYRGALGDKSRLILIGSDGKTQSSVQVPGEVVGLYRSCINDLYYVSTEGFYWLSAGNGKIRVAEKKYKPQLLPLLKQCQVFYNDHFYYKYLHRDSFVARFAYAHYDSAIQHEFYKLEDSASAEVSLEEYHEILRLLDNGLYKDAFRWKNNRGMWDREALGKINGDIYKIDTSLVIFNFLKKTLHHYTYDGTPIKDIPLQINWKTIKRLEVVCDAERGSFFIHRFDNNSAHYLEKLDIHTGRTTERINIDKPLITKLKVYNGKLYYLYQNKADQSVLQLYSQEF
ncbi:MAG: hypothetical protein EOP56_01660 [Sphingobacteriales bacterium]|nr:MAG: hypothetical protein EOP56_01660 [Sphingobacteriales bacterium]